MDCDQMLQEFNLLWNNIMSNQAPGLNPYEISLFLTQAQEAVLVSLYDGSQAESFEQTEELTSYLSTLVKTARLVKMSDAEIEHEGLSDSMIVPESVLFRLPDDFLARTYESCILKKDGKQMMATVVPCTQDAFWRTYNNPFRGPEAPRRALRVAFDNVNDEGGIDHYSEIIASKKASVVSYTVRYVSKPSPIVLVDLPESLSIDGVRVKTPCRLNDHLQRKIIAQAVALAKSVWS